MRLWAEIKKKNVEKKFSSKFYIEKVFLKIIHIPKISRMVLEFVACGEQEKRMKADCHPEHRLQTI